MNALRLLLGPQRPAITFDEAIASLDIGDAPIAVISAAWQEAEGDIDAMRRLVKNPLTDLNLYQRAIEVFTADKLLHTAYRERQERLKEQQRLYQARLKQLMIAARKTLRDEGSPPVIAAERRHAIAQLRELDRHHIRQIRKTHLRFDSQFNPGCSSLLADQGAAIAEALEGTGTVLITGGNMVVLLNRLRLFGLADLLMPKNVVAWSAGAMALGQHVVLFHDGLPQGRRDAEILGEGLGLLPNVIALPNAEGRLRTGDTVRTSLFSRRFSPLACLTLNNGASLLFEGDELRKSVLSKRLTRGGNLRRVRPS